MLYPIYVHKEADSAYGVIFPDFPGCFLAVEDARDISRLAQESVEAHFYGDTAAIAFPSTPDTVADDKEYAGGFWMMVDIDPSKMSTKAVRLNISMPQNLVAEIDAYATANHMTRSALLAYAMKSIIDRSKGVPEQA